jgi:hypothetical protein
LVSTPHPSGVTIPMPVTTTRLISFPGQATAEATRAWRRAMNHIPN